MGLVPSGREVMCRLGESGTRMRPVLEMGVDGD